MKPTSKTIFLCLLILTVFLNACGGNTTTGSTQGTSVSIQSQIKTGTPTILVFNNYTGTLSQAPSADFTLKSVINGNSGSNASDISIHNEVFSFEYIGGANIGGATPTVLSPTFKIPDLVYFSNLIVPAGGTTDWQNVPVMLSEAKAYLKTNNPLLSNTGEVQFRVRVTFNGTEINSGTSLSPSTTFTLLLTQ